MGQTLDMPTFNDPETRSRGQSLQRRVTVWMGLGAMVATGAAAAAVANSIPGRPLGSSPAASSASAAPSTAGSSSVGGAGAVAAPTPAPAGSVPAVTSGGS